MDPSGSLVASAASNLERPRRAVGHSARPCCGSSETPMVGPYGDQQWQEYGFSAPVANDLMTSRAGSRKLLTTAFTAASDRDLKARAWSGRRGPLTGRAGRL